VTDIFLLHVGEWQALSNVHGLLHLPESVSDIGPLWAHSCFPFESGNGVAFSWFSKCSEAGINCILTLCTVYARI
jgi:hypothetical protein